MPSSRFVQTACRMDLYSQAQNLGILTQFVDGQGQTRLTDEAALKIIIDALPARTERHLVDGPVVIRPGEPSHTELSQTAKLPVRWTITAGSRVIGEGETDGRTIHWPEVLPSGAHRLRLTDRTSASEDVPLIVAPKAFAGDFDRTWLIAVQLYGVRSARNWGMGDFTDLKKPDRACEPTRRRRHRPQSAACAVRRPADRLQPLCAEQPPVPQSALHRCRSHSGTSRRRRSAKRWRGCGNRPMSTMPASPN